MSNVHSMAHLVSEAVKKSPKHESKHESKSESIATTASKESEEAMNHKWSSSLTMRSHLDVVRALW